MSLKNTLEKRPELLENADLSKDDIKFLEELKKEVDFKDKI